MKNKFLTINLRRDWGLTNCLQRNKNLIFRYLPNHIICNALLIFASLISTPATNAQTNNSIKPGALWHDTNHNLINAHGGGMLFHDGRYYWFGEHKVEGIAGNFAQVGVHCYSSSDLYNWKDEGISLKVSNDPDNELARGCIIERPKVIYNQKTKKFVMWFHYEPKGKGYKSALSRIAVSDKVTGAFYVYKKFEA